MLRCSHHLLSTLALVTAVGAAHAAELGEARVSSHIGQPLVADIELAMVDDPAQTVAVRVASPEVYNGAGIAVPPVLANLNLSVMRRDGRQFLHVTSLRPIDSEHLHLYLELTDKGQRAVRLATLWLTPDPNPAPAPAPVPATVKRAEPAPAAVATPAMPPAPVRKPVAARKPEPAAAAHAEEEGAKQPPAKPRPQAKPAAAAFPLPIHAPQAAAPAACTQQVAQAQVCAALDGKNAELNAKIGTLEGKVKSLQATLGAAPAAVKPAPAPAAEHAPAETEHAPAETGHAPKAAPAPAPAPEVAHEPPGPKPISAIKPLVPRKHKTPPPEPESSLPWGWIGAVAALLLALGGATLLLRRRARTVRNVDIPAAPRLIDRVRHSFASRGKADPASAANPAKEAAPEAAHETAEPSFE